MMNRLKIRFKLQASSLKLVTCGLWLVALNAKALPMDSLRMETINGKQYIIHQVDPKETLFSISRRYGVPVTDLAQENPSAGSGISVGQLLKCPYIPRVKPRRKNGNIVNIEAPKRS